MADLVKAQPGILLIAVAESHLSPLNRAIPPPCVLN
ncbi:hypothetical protein HDF17_001384 [Granulicella arctica]|uniref:Uncharacterized protein n=1 Tax=Granulicella arctica TaxID=940613 RepID=A0A7Y9PFY9_9BACT|nr:hypothetical protein [Granulicella arctica]